MKKLNINENMVLSLPICIVTTLLCFPIGLIFITLRLHRSGRVPEQMKNIIVNMIIGAIIFVFLIVGYQSCSGGCIASSADSSQTELSGFLGKPLSEMEESLDEEFVDMTEYWDNTYRIDYRDALIDCTIDSNGNVIKIHLRESGKKNYSLFGVDTNMSKTEIENELKDKGITFVRDSMWKCPNGTDGFIIDSSSVTGSMSFIYEKNSKALAEEIYLAKIESEFTFQDKNSVGRYYLGNGQFIEYIHPSYAAFMYEYDNLTSYQKEEMNRIIDGKYIAAMGEVSSVSADGIITITCKDEEASEAAGLLMPYNYSASLELIPEQQNELISLLVGDTITVFGQIDAYSYYNFLDLGGSFDLLDAILLSNEHGNVDVPILQRDIYGITRFNANGELITGDMTYSQAEQNTNENPIITTTTEENQARVDAIMQEELLNYPYPHYDDMTGSYYAMYGSNDISVEITAYDNGYDFSAKYYLTYQTSSVCLRNIPAYQVDLSRVDEGVYSLMFDFTPYFPEHSGIVEILYNYSDPIYPVSINAVVEGCSDTDGYYAPMDVIE